jgi:hypothetical protein
MYVCMYVCMRMYVCKYVCKYVCGVCGVCVLGGGGNTFIAALDRDIVVEAHVPPNERDVEIAALAHPLRTH